MDDAAFAAMLQQQLEEEARQLEQQQQASVGAGAGGGGATTTTLTREQQEEEDARLARLLAESGGSFRDLITNAPTATTVASNNTTRVVEPNLPSLSESSSHSTASALTPTPTPTAPRQRYSPNRRSPQAFSPPSLQAPSSVQSGPPRQQRSPGMPRTSNHRSPIQTRAQALDGGGGSISMDLPFDVPGSDLFDSGALSGSGQFDSDRSSDKKKKKKKGILGGLFGRNKDNNNNNNQQEEEEETKEPDQQLTPQRQQQTLTAMPRIGSLGLDGTTQFNVPAPVQRPTDTIGAPRGPLPFSYSITQNAPSVPQLTAGRRNHNMVGLGRNSTTCSVCTETVQNPVNALGKKYHPDCFRCITCHEVIDSNGNFAFTESNDTKQPMHTQCYQRSFGVLCSVCHDAIPSGPDGKIQFVKHPFFDTELMCPSHARSGTRRCTGCHRFEPQNEPFADLNDVGRSVCMACCRTVIVDSQDAQPLWNEVVEFFDKKLHLPLWKDFKEVPILIVGYQALNAQMQNTSNVHGGATQIMTRGICLTEHESGRRFQANTMQYNEETNSFGSTDAEDRGFTYFQVPDASKTNPDASVTAIMCLSGLPKDLTASVLAHEATHAWIKLHPQFKFEKPIPPVVEEGVAQLIALLFLSDGLEPPRAHDGPGPSDEKLRQYFKFNIETDDNEIYGYGFRQAAMAYSHIGIEALMSHIVLYQNFPEV